MPAFNSEQCAVITSLDFSAATVNCHANVLKSSRMLAELSISYGH